MRPISVLCVIALLAACGSEVATIGQLPLADEDASLAAGAYKDFQIPIDLGLMEAPAVIGTLATSVSTETLNLLVLDQANFTLFAAGQTYVAYFESGQRTGGNINIPFTTEGTWHLVLSNRASATPTAYSFVLSLFWTVR